MTTPQLTELQRSITQGEWIVLPGGDVCTTLKTEIDFGGTTGKRPVQLLVGKINNYTTQAPEPVANATAIALVPELIAEVIRLRALLAEVELDLAVAVDSKHSTTAIANVYDKVCIGRAALANDK